MAGAGVLFEIHDEQLQGLIAKMEGGVKDLSPVMKNFGEAMVNRTEGRFDNEEAPDGSGWVKLKPATEKRKIRIGKNEGILHESGHLKGTIHPSFDANSLEISSGKVYSAIHQFGGKAGPGLKVTIPKREYLGFNDDDIEEFREAVKDYIILGKKP